jgi:hypothetical protein
MILAFSVLKPGTHSLKISHASVAICSAIAMVNIYDQTEPRIVKLSPSSGDFSQPGFFELQVVGGFPTKQFLVMGILFSSSGQHFVVPWSVISIVLADSIHTVTIRSSVSPEPGTCILQMQFSNGLRINSSNLSLVNRGAPTIQSVRFYYTHSISH